MLSRVAESLYWLSRYSERAESVARFVDVNYNLTLGKSEALSEQWTPLVYTTGDHEDFEKRYNQPTRENVLRFLLFDKENRNSILSCVNSAREAARTVREVLPAAVWEQVNRFYLMVKEASLTEEALNQPYDFCEAVRMASHLMIGITSSSMLRDEAWYFMQAGRYIERADKTSRIVDVQYFLLLPKTTDVGSSIDIVRWSSLLKSADALEMYRQMHGRIVPSKVAAFLILDPMFPRSIQFCVRRAQQSLSDMARSDPERNSFASTVLAHQLNERLSSLSIEDIISQGMHAFIDQLQGALNSLGAAIYTDFFNVQVQQQRFESQSQELPAMSQSQS